VLAAEGKLSSGDTTKAIEFYEIHRRRVNASAVEAAAAQREPESAASAFMYKTTKAPGHVIQILLKLSTACRIELRTPATSLTSVYWLRRNFIVSSGPYLYDRRYVIAQL
jgi:hypothetical protein